MTETHLTPWAKPIFRWAGSKRRVIPLLSSLIPRDYARYFEPFVGSGCMFFALKPQRAVLADLNGDLIEAYGVIRDHPRLVTRATLKLPNTKRAYYSIRAVDPKTLDPIARTARFFYLNRFCFNGVYRVNRAGAFNVPRGVRTGAIPSETAVYRSSLALRGAQLVHGDFETTLSDVSCDDFVYLDPPYASTRRNTYGEYGYGCFDESRHSELRASLRQIDRAGATFLLSYCSHSFIDLLPKRWRRREVRVRRHVAGFTDKRKLVTEVLVSNRSFGPSDTRT